VLSCFFEPSSEVFEGLSSGDVVDEEGACGATVVGSGDGAEGFLAGGVPYLKLDGFISNINHPRTKFNTNRKIMNRLETFIGEL